MQSLKMYYIIKYNYIIQLYLETHNYTGARGGVVVEALRYKPEGREFDSRWCHWIFSLT
jgi:hypothetical protein